MWSEVPAGRVTAPDSMIAPGGKRDNARKGFRPGARAGYNGAMRLRASRSLLVEPALPAALEPLRRLSENLFWTWNTDAVALFERIDRDAWQETVHNPVRLLQRVPSAHWEALADDDGFRRHLERVVEAFDAYMSRNSGFEGIGFPKPKFREKDKTASPEKYKQLRQEYKSAVRTFIVAMPESVHGIEADLNGIDPYRAWTQMQTDRNRRVQRRTIELAQKSYLAARTDTDLNGRGAFAGLPSGDYWIGTLATPATAGDVRLHWDLHVVVRPGETARLELSNLNAAEPLGLAQNSAP